MRLFVLLVFGSALAGAQGAPINAKCPVKPAQNARAANVLVYEGQTIGFC